VFFSGSSPKGQSVLYHQNPSETVSKSAVMANLWQRKLPWQTTRWGDDATQP
jgi:hypothetical protein